MQTAACACGLRERSASFDSKRRSRLDVLQHSAVAGDRSMAAYNLTLMGSDAESAVPTLQTMQNDQRKDVARAVAQALEAIQRRPR
jgi:hypothetical protein